MPSVFILNISSSEKFSCSIISLAFPSIFISPVFLCTWINLFSLRRWFPCDLRPLIFLKVLFPICPVKSILKGIYFFFLFSFLFFCHSFNAITFALTDVIVLQLATGIFASLPDEMWAFRDFSDNLTVLSVNLPI